MCNFTSVPDRVRTRRSGISFPTLAVLTCVLLFALTVGASLSSAQLRTTRLIYVTATDSVQRFVTGLGQADFEIVENGLRRPITYFSGVDSPISVAVVGEELPVDAANLFGPEDQLIQTRSLTDGLQQLQSSRNPRKALILTATSDIPTVSDGVHVVRANPATLLRTVVEIRNQYLLGFEAAAPSAPIEVLVRSPRGLPVLKPNW